MIKCCNNIIEYICLQLGLPFSFTLPMCVFIRRQKVVYGCCVNKFLLNCVGLHFADAFVRLAH